MRSSLIVLSLACCCWFRPLMAQVPGADIDILHYDFSLWLNDADNHIRGEATVTLQFIKEAHSFSLDLVRKNSSDNGMTVSAVLENGKELRFRQDSEKLNIFPAGPAPGKPASATAGSLHTYTIKYAGIPADGLVIGRNKFGRRGFFGDNWPNRAHNWLPCVDHPADKATVDFNITAPDHYQVVANGRREKETPLPSGFKLTQWKESIPLSTKVMVIGVADFAIDHPGDVDGFADYSYVFQENKEQGFQSYSIAMEILPFYIKKIGPYPYEKLANVQSRTRFGGLENASAIFYFENSVGSPGIESLMAHEIAHQWFGDAVTETDWPHLWLSEGFATYMTHSYLENKYGTDTLLKGMQKDRMTVINFEKQRFTPIIDTSTKGEYMQLLNPNNYEKGGWVLHMLRRKLGDTAFWKGMVDYFASYKNRNASSADFERTMEKAGGQPLATFFHQWLYVPGHPRLGIQWSYDPGHGADGGILTIKIEQKQNTLYEFPLEYALVPVDTAPAGESLASAGKEIHRVLIRDKTTVVHLPLASRPSSIIIDPAVNLLADFDVSAQ